MRILLCVFCALAAAARGEDRAALRAEPFALSGSIEEGEVWKGSYRIDVRTEAPRATDGRQAVEHSLGWETRVVEAGDSLKFEVTFDRMELAERGATSTKAVSHDREQLGRILGRRSGDGPDIRLESDTSWRLTDSEGLGAWFWIMGYAGFSGVDQSEGAPGWLQLIRRLLPRSMGRALARAHDLFERVAGGPLDQAGREFWNGTVLPASEVLGRLHAGGTFQPGDEIAFPGGTIRYQGLEGDSGRGSFRAALTGRGANPFQPPGEQGFEFAIDDAGRLARLEVEVALVAGLPVGASGRLVFEIEEVRRPAR